MKELLAASILIAALVLVGICIWAALKMRRRSRDFEPTYDPNNPMNRRPTRIEKYGRSSFPGEW